MNYVTARSMIKRRVDNAKLNKKVYLNLFRHSEATKMANFMTEAQMRKRHGWTATSKMPSRYVHLVNADVENAIFEHYGIKKKEESKPDTPTKCQFCDMFNPHDSDTCSKCAKPLDLETAIKQDEKTQEEKDQLNQTIESLQSKLSSYEEKFQEVEELKEQNIANRKIHDDELAEIKSTIARLVENESLKKKVISIPQDN